jgi:hypothetical protein
VGNAVLHYKPVGGTIPLPINGNSLLLLGKGIDESFVTTVTTVTKVTTGVTRCPVFHDDGKTCSFFFRHPGLTRNMGFAKTDPESSSG